MSDERRRGWRWLAAIAVVAIGGVALVKYGGPRTTNGNGPKPSNEQREDPLAAGLNRLERADDVVSCREGLSLVESSNEYQHRPQLTEEQLRRLAEALRLFRSEVEGLNQQTFTTVDAEYLTECFLLRDAMRSLELEGLPPLERAEQAFAWVCRQVYLSDKKDLPPGTPWWVLQAGSGSGYDRAYVFLAALQQLGLDGCFIGPPELETSHWLGRSSAPTIAAIGVRVGGDIFLFDPWLGAPVQRGGKTATLAQVRGGPSSVQDWLNKRSLAADQVKRWGVFLAAPLPALEARMDWLEKQLPPSAKAHLSVDALALRERFQKEALGGALAGTKCAIWNPPPINNFGISFGRYLEAFNREAKPGQPSLKGKFVEVHFPSEFLNKLADGVTLEDMPPQALRKLHNKFRREFENVFLTARSPRDELLHGNFSNAITALTEQKDRNDLSHERFLNEDVGPPDVKAWKAKALQLAADLERAELGNNSGELIQAQEADEEFAKSSESQRMAYLVLLQTSALLSADASYQLALVAQEQAERAMAQWRRQPNEKTQAEAERLWKRAASGWESYFGNSSGQFKDRDRQAELLRGECAEAKKSTVK
jgi:hypothetical protein